MSDVQQAYNSWAQQYDTNENKTRDLEARSLRETLSSISFEHCLEIGCGTGKNTVWLLQKAETVTAVDLSEEMLAKAKEKLNSSDVTFIQPVLEKAAAALKVGGHLYISELHPFKQYSGSKARFETEAGTQVDTCFNHHITDFTGAAEKANMELVSIKEYFDDDDRNNIPRLLTLLFIKK